MKQWVAYILLASGRWFYIRFQVDTMDEASGIVSEFVNLERANGSRIITWWVERDNG